MADVSSVKKSSNQELWNAPTECVRADNFIFYSLLTSE